MVYRCPIFVGRPCRNNDGWPQYGKWRKFDEEDKKRGKSEKAQKLRISSDPRKIIIIIHSNALKVKCEKPFGLSEKIFGGLQ